MDSTIIAAIIAGAVSIIVALITVYGKRKKGRTLQPSESDGLVGDRNGTKKKSPAHVTSKQPVTGDETLPPGFDDIALWSEHLLGKLPVTDSPENTLFQFSEKLFMRPAFYYHPERNFYYALYATVLTRLVWEQQVIPRVRQVRKKDAGRVLESLLKLEDFLARAIGLETEELTHLTSQYIRYKERFIELLPRGVALFNFQLEEQRRQLLIELRNATTSMGLSTPNIGEALGFSHEA